ncbi:nucleotidyltransferase domain-containing protein [bacterium]|nr:nucleotidyltransferase domain-containing protein [bacterium]
MDTKLKGLSGLKRLVDFITTEYKPERIILFGSYGSETEKRYSDIDLLIIKKTSKRFVDRVVEVMQNIRREFGIKYPVEPLVYTPEEWEAAKVINSIFIRTILSKGIVLYGKE